MIFIKKTDVKNVSEEFKKSKFVPGAKTEAFILADEEMLQAICAYEAKKEYILLEKIICPSQKPVYIDAIVRALLSSKLDEGYIYGLLADAEDEIVQKTLIDMTGFQPITQEKEYMIDLLFDKENAAEGSLYVDIFQLFMHHKCGKVQK
ncbi:MAG: hypothetical protein GX245_05680 [Eubacteriaceae bacterium]|jgi:hypothetical protein|nr:hypothetical protein [Eubacteriaceae bacterium]